jgi:hypothetical protein
VTEQFFSFFMSQELRKAANEERDISRTATEGTQIKYYEGFEGVNYEQIRQPFHPQNKGRNNAIDRRKDSKRPDEG